MRRERLDDGSMIEDLVVTVDDREFHGTLRIKRVDRTTSAFEVDFGMHHHEDSSLFPHGALEQMRLHARAVLENMVRKHREGEESS